MDDSAFNAMGAAGAASFARQSFWGGALSPYAQITQFWHEDAAAITASGGWRYEGAVERFLQGVPLSNGRYRDLGAVVTPTIRVVGQKDAQAGSAVFWVQNLGPTEDGSEAANWFNLTMAPAMMTPVTGTVTIPGLPSGSYEADVWNTSTGQFDSSLFLTTAGGRSVRAGQRSGRGRGGEGIPGGLGGEGLPGGLGPPRPAPDGQADRRDRRQSRHLHPGLYQRRDFARPGSQSSLADPGAHALHLGQRRRRL